MNPEDWPRIRIVSGRAVALVASAALLALTLCLMWGDSPRQPTMRAGSTSTPAIYTNKEP